MEDLKQDWVEVELGSVSDITSSKRILKEEYVSEGIPFYRTKEIKELSEGKDVSIELFISNKRYFDIKEKFNVPKVGDILISAVGTIGISYVIKNNSPFYFKDGNLIWIREINGLQSKYLNFGLTHYVRNNKKLDTSGTAYNALTIEKLKTLPFPIAPLPIQRAIVLKIENLFASLDKGIADLEKAQQQLKVYRQAVLKKAFEGRLTSVKMEKRPISKLTNLVTKGASPNWQGFNYTNDSNELLFVTSENVREGFISLEKEKYLPVGFNEIQKRSVLQKGDILFNIVGASIGRAAIYNLDKIANINQAVALIRLNNDILGQYVNYFLNSEGAKQEYLKKQVEVARANLSLQNVNEIEIPFCKKEEQQSIIKEIESRLSVCDKVEQSIAESLEKAKALRQSILKKAFEGKLLSEAEIAQCKQEKDYEPASVLLERIKQSRRDEMIIGKPKTTKFKTPKG